MDGDLISRADAFRAIDKLYLNGDFGLDNDGGEIYAKCHNTLNSVPAVDAEPVKRARWKPSPAPYVLPRCSRCGEIGFAHWAACPNCGAIMEGEGGNG